MKILFLIIGLGLGFAGGVFWGVHHPAQASQLAGEEERRFLEAQVKVTEAIKSKLDQLASRQSQSAKGPGSGFVSGIGGSSGPDPEIASLRDQSDHQLQDLHKRLDQLK